MPDVSALNGGKFVFILNSTRSGPSAASSGQNTL